MADNNGILDDLKDSVADKLEDKLDPSKVFSEGNLKKKRGAFWTCFIAALLLVALAFAGSLAYNATKVSLFRDGITNNVDLTALGISESSAESFATSTIAYLQGTVSAWEPVIVMGDHVMPIPDTFKAHMATVKGWVSSATAVLLAGAAIVLVLLGRAMIGTKGSKRSPFSLGGYYLGAAIPLLALVGVGAWGYFNFDGLWAWVHQTFIPDGIFDAAEPIMQLFPLGLFSGYLKPVGITFGICAAVILVLPLILKPLSSVTTSLFGKRAASKSRSSRSTTRRKTSTAKRTSKQRSASR